MNDKKQGIIYIIMAGFFFALMTFFCENVGRFADHAEGLFQECGSSSSGCYLTCKKCEGFK